MTIQIFEAVTLWYYDALMKYFLLLLLSGCFALAQQKALEIKIDSITAKDTEDGERKFVVNYHLKNNGPDKISLLLKPTAFSSISFGSLQNVPFYKIYENENFMDLGYVFEREGKGLNSGHISLDWKDPAKKQKIKNELRDTYHFPDSLIEEYERLGYITTAVAHKDRNIFDELLGLEPFESKSYEVFFFWDKDPYFAYDEHEYLLDTKSKHYIEFTIISMQEQFQNQLKEDEFSRLMAIPHFAVGIFTSNKIEINFSEEL